MSPQRALVLVFASMAASGAAGGLGGCATASSGGEADAGIVIADADPNAPDADPNAPDAMTNNNTPDAGGSCPTSPCDLIEQCGCAPPQVCDLDGAQLATGGTACRDVSTPGTDLATCTSSTGCAGGYICLGSNPRQCREYCDPANDTCGTNGPGSFCTIYIVYDSGGGNYEPVPGAVACTKSCNPIETAPTGCPTGMGCHVSLFDPNCDPDNDGVPDGGCTFDGDEFAQTDCAGTTAGGQDGASCAWNGDCAPSFDCINVGGNPQCKQSCVCTNTTVGDGEVCNTAAVCGVGSCRRFAAPHPVINGTEYGVCL